MRGALANGEELQGARLRCGFTQEELAKLAYLDVKTVRKAERGMRLDLDTLTRLAFALQTELIRIIRTGRSETEMQIGWRDAVIRWHRAWDANDIDALLATYHDDAVLHLPGGPNIPFGGTFRGKNEIRRAHEIAWSTCRTEPVPPEDFSLLASGNAIVLNGFKGVHLPNGEVVRLGCMQIFKFEGDLIIDHRVEYDTLKFAQIVQFPAALPGGGSKSSR